MHEIHVIKDIVIILSISIPIIFLFKKLKLPSIVGFLIAGIIIGPHGFKFIDEVEQIEIMAEIGVILLLFTIGLEISVKKLLQMKKLLIYGGGLQLGITILFVSIFMIAINLPVNESIFIGMLVGVSSTAIVLKLLSDKDEIESPHGKIAVGILIFQDLAIVPMILLLPLLGGIGEELSLFNIVYQLLFAFGIAAVIIIVARFLMPKILYQLAKMRIREVFTVGVILLLLGTAYLTASVGLSFAMGAFIAGLVISESDFSHEIFAQIIPFKDAFNSIFFVSIGLLLDMGFVFVFPGYIALAFFGVMILKGSIIYGIIRVLKYPVRIALISALSLVQIGEFSFVLSQVGRNFNLIGDNFYNGFLAISIFTMLATPLIFDYAPVFINNFITRSDDKNYYDVKKKMSIKNHVIIIGFGSNGRNLARVLKETGIPYNVIELNPETVRKCSEKGENIIYGDSTRKDILYHAGIENANVIVFAISDPHSTKISLKIAKSINPDIFSIVRTRYTTEIDELIELGADIVIPEEFETSLQIFSNVLKRYHIPLNIIMKQIALLRNESYKLMVKEDSPNYTLAHLDEILAQGLTETFYVDSSNQFIGKSIIQINLRAKTDATIIAIIREGKTISNPSAKEIIYIGDTLIIVGTHKSVDNAIHYLNQ